MANRKIVYLPYYAPSGSGLFARVIQISTQRILDYADGIFRLTPAQPDYPLVQHSSIPSLFGFEENRQIWDDGEYQVYGYEPGYVLFAGANLYISDDIEVSQVDILESTKLVKSIEEGNWELKDDKWIYYAADGVTVLREFKLYDQYGNPTMVNIFKRERV
jgi:hypothetical protein